MIVTVHVGRAWDSYWHATQPFDDFSPHVFVYTMTALNVVVVMALAWRERQQAPVVARLAPLPWLLPPELVLVIAALLTVSFAGLVLDNLWHSTFGLDETFWSTPHAMLGWAGRNNT
jgi:hypothetical protein